MANSISLSNDLKSLYLIDAERVIVFDLTTPSGVLVGKIQGQLSAVSAHEMSTPTTAREKPDTVFIDIKSDNQYTLTYNRGTAALGLIGATDIIQTIGDPGDPPIPSGNCDLNLYSLESHDVLIRRKGDTLEFTRLEKVC